MDSKEKGNKDILMDGGIISSVRQILDHEGWRYEINNNNILLLVAFQTKKWKMVINCEGKMRVCCFSVFPWVCSEDRLIKIWGLLNELNFAQQTGCFVINTADNRVVYRFGIHILDEFTSHEYIKEVLLSSVAIVNANWDKVHGIIFWC